MPSSASARAIAAPRGCPGRKVGPTGPGHRPVGPAVAHRPGRQRHVAIASVVPPVRAWGCPSLARTDRTALRPTVSCPGRGGQAAGVGGHARRRRTRPRRRSGLRRAPRSGEVAEEPVPHPDGDAEEGVHRPWGYGPIAAICSSLTPTVKSSGAGPVAALRLGPMKATSSRKATTLQGQGRAAGPVMLRPHQYRNESPRTPEPAARS